MEEQRYCKMSRQIIKKVYLYLFKRIKKVLCVTIHSISSVYFDGDPFRFPLNYSITVSTDSIKKIVSLSATLTSYIALNIDIYDDGNLLN